MATIIFKPTEKCNSNCIYCDVVTRKKPKTMSLDLLEHIFKNIDEYLKSKPKEHIQLIWHGGEPLLLGEDYFLKAIEFQEKYCPETKNRIDHAIQSNLTLLNENYLKIFRSMGINQIGTSFEPLPNMRGPGPNRDSAFYNSRFMKGINMLEKNNFGWGFIYVVTKKSLERPLDIFFYLSNLKPTGGFMLNPVLIYGNDKHDIAMTQEEYADFLGAIFPYWWKHRDRYPHVNPFKMFVENIIENKRTTGCEDTGNCAYGHVYLGPNGEASQCGRAGDWDIISYGNIKERSLIEIMQDKQREQFIERNNILLQGECKNCPIWEFCHGGCPLDSYIKNKNFMHRTNRCEGKKLFLEKYFLPITGARL
ncbi:MAG: radical SAM protein [Bacteroidetes bacterium]|nr:radical SAM protein [Bacteroidota bacterium]